MKTLQSKQKSKNRLSPLTIGFIVSCVLHLSLFAMLLHDNSQKIAIKTNNTISINLSNIVAPNPGNQIEKPEPKKKKHHKKHEKRKEKPKEHVKKEIIKPQEIAEKTEKVVEAKEEAVEEIAEADINDSEDTEEVISDKRSIAGGGGSQTYLSEDNSLFLMIKNSIDKYNEYPRIARKRVLEGDVLVEFIIFKNGIVDKIKVISGQHNVLNQSAVNAIKKAAKEFPNMQQDTRVKITISYNLNKI